jgi:steroid 5-alpha reductase family enzyme
MSYLSLLGWIALFILGMMTAIWILSLILKNTSIVDIFWGLGFVLVNWLSIVLLPGPMNLNRLILALLVSIWGLRLTTYILIRNAGKGEDYRYQKWRTQYGKRWWWVSFFQTYLLQGVLMWIIAVPISGVHYFSAESSFNVFSVLGIVVWAIGFFFEAVGDAQLARFKANPENKGKLLQTGVWRYTRHPNYFGDSAQWWAFYLIAIAAGAWWTIFSPILMTFFLIRVSGVAMLEKALIETKPGYREYAARTNSFIPWFPKKTSGS